MLSLCVTEATYKVLRDVVERSARRHESGRLEARMRMATMPMPPDWPRKAVPACAIADAAFNAKPEIVQPPPDTDRMWDLLVLAARTSRYGE